MSQQPMNLRRGTEFVRRHKTMVGVIMGLGLLGGAAFGSINPPPLTTQALVVLPNNAPAMPTELVIAVSDPVLNGALPNISPAQSGITALRHQVESTSASPNIVTITGKGGSAPTAESIANAVANSYVSYLASSQSPVGRVNAHLLQSANSASGPSPLTHRLVYGIIGLLSGLIAGIIAALVLGRTDRRLRGRDEIANSIGIPVLASLPVSHPANPQDWSKLLDTYEPGVVHAWRLRKTLQHLNVTGLDITGTRESGDSSVAVVSLTSDQHALALGPQLAVFAASLGIPTMLAIAPGQNPNSVAALRAACAGWRRHGNLRTAVIDSEDDPLPGDAVFTVLVATVDGKGARPPGLVNTTATLVGVSSGGTTAEQLARVAMWAAGDGRDVSALLVADPDASDHTTGRIPQLPRSAERMPTRLTGTTTEARR
jgi:hypothetical protein